MSQTPKPLGGLLAELRREAGLTQTELARRAAVKRDYLSSVEGGRIGLMYPAPMNAVCEVLGVPGWRLLDAMGYETDADDDRVIPALLVELRKLDGPQQRALLAFVRSMTTRQKDSPDV